MLTLQSKNIEKAFFISPILDIEKLMLDMMVQANVTEKDLKDQRGIETNFGKTLSWNYLTFVRNNPIAWDIPTNILYAEYDNMTSRETVDKFVNTHNATLTVMRGGEHRFHTTEQLNFLAEWLSNNL